MNTTPTQQQDPTTWIASAADPSIWNRGSDHRTACGYAHQYDDSKDANWQAWRNGFCLSGIVRGLDAAKAMADEMLALPIEEFNARCAVSLREELKKNELDLLRLQPDTTLLPGFHAGYEQGVLDTKRKIEAVLS